MVDGTSIATSTFKKIDEGKAGSLKGFFWVVATQISFWNFTPKIGEMLQFDEQSVQMGWFNHQPPTSFVSCGEQKVWT